ncbi:MAG: RraA family protein [Thermoanaerobaculia bacterium]
MRHERLLGFLFVATLSAGVLHAQSPDEPTADHAALALFDGLRVADVTDGMDVVGLRGVGLVDTRIQPLWKDLDEFDHQIRGIAITVRYVPHNRIVPNPMSPEEFAAWEGAWYGEISPEPFVESIRPGTVIVIDASGNGDTGSIGSYNSLAWTARGAVGIVTTGSVRDTDEIIKQQIPLYHDPLQRGRGIRPGRNMIESVGEPVEIGGAYVRPGDVIVADGDGVVVVPREHAAAVARAARLVLEKDKEARRALYEELGRPLDVTVRPDDDD